MSIKDKVTLESEEVTLIRKFIEDASDIALIDGIYIDAYYSEEFGTQIYVNALSNESKYYIEQLVVSGYVVDKESNYYDMSVLKGIYQTTGRLHFGVEPVNDSSGDFKMIMSKKMALLSGTILFDRFTNLYSEKKLLEKSFSQFPTALRISNIFDLSVKHKGKGKSIR